MRAMLEWQDRPKAETHEGCAEVAPPATVHAETQRIMASLILAHGMLAQAPPLAPLLPWWEKVAAKRSDEGGAEVEP